MVQSPEWKDFPAEWEDIEKLLFVTFLPYLNFIMSLITLSLLNSRSILDYLEMEMIMITFEGFRTFF